MRTIIDNINDLTKEDFSRRQLYDELFDIKNEMDRSEVQFQLAEKARTYQVIGVFKKMVSLKEREIKEEAAVMNRNLIQCVNNVTEFLPDKKDKSYVNMACGSWIATEDGIYSLESSQAKSLVCYHPIMPVRRLKNLETGEEQITIAYKRDGEWNEVIVPKIEIASPRTIINLARFGIQVDSETAKNLIKFLRDVEMYNSDLIKISHSTGKLGWHGKDFIPYDKTIQFDGENKFKSLYASICQEGNYSVWLDAMIDLREKEVKEARIALAASFSSALIQPLGVLPFIVDFYGQTGGGKTVTINVAASVWGNPEAGAYVGNFRSTDVGLETRSDMLNNFPLILDDSNNASKFIKDNYETLIYNLCSGKGKARSNKELGAMKENTWKNVTICNGERPISDFADSGGAINRIIEVECLEDIYDNPVKVNETVMRNYGFAGEIFTSYIQEKSIDELKELKKEIENSFDECNTTAKQKMAAAILLLADKLATECVFMDGNALSVEDIKDILTEKSRVSEGQRCYEFLMELPEISPGHFDPSSNVDQWGPPDEARINDERYRLFYAISIEKVLKSNNFSRKSFTAWAMTRNLLKHDKKRDTYTKKENGKPTRYIAVKILDSEYFDCCSDNWNELKEKSDFIGVNSKEIIPFS